MISERAPSLQRLLQSLFVCFSICCFDLEIDMNVNLPKGNNISMPLMHSSLIKFEITEEKIDLSLCDISMPCIMVLVVYMRVKCTVVSVVVICI